MKSRTHNGPEGYVKYKPTREEIEQNKRNRKYDKEQREYAAEERKENRIRKQNVKREIAVLKFMLKNDVKFYHHSTESSMLETIKRHLEALKEPDARWNVYDPYIWNRQGEGNNTTSRCLLGNLWDRTEDFETIYDVPLDGTYKFVITDSGSRGLGSYNYIRANKVDEEVYVQKVNPGAFRGFGF
jgi:hypothetical protein